MLLLIADLLFQKKNWYEIRCINYFKFCQEFVKKKVFILILCIVTKYCTVRTFQTRLRQYKYVRRNLLFMSHKMKDNLLNKKNKKQK